MLGIKLGTFEKVWLYTFSTIILLTTFWFSWTGTDYKSIWSILLNWVVSPASAITGVFCVGLAAKGHINNVWWGIVNSLAYGFVAWVSGYYGDWMLNWFFFLPTQLFIWMTWHKKLNQDGIVSMKRLTNKQVVLIAVGTLVAIYGFAVFLTSVDNFFTKAFERNATFYTNLDKVTHFPLLGPLMDSSTVILQVVAQALMIFMYAEQWPIWIAVNVISSAIWGIVIWTDPTSVSYAVPTLVMWLAFLVNSVYGTRVWYKNSKNLVPMSKRL